MSDTTSIILIDASLDELPDGSMVIRGILDPACLTSLKIGEYQREQLSNKTIQELYEVLNSGQGVTDIELGVRGENYKQVRRRVLFFDEAYVIDGQQRLAASKLMVEAGNGDKIHLGAKVHLNTTEIFERDLFRKLNMDRTRLSTNVLLRNYQYDYSAIRLLVELSEDSTFALHNRICWKQRKTSELISALTLAKVVGFLHSHLGHTRGTDITLLTTGLQEVVDLIGEETFCANVRTFFDVIDKAYGIKRVVFKEGASFLHSGYLTTVARLLSSHEDFWNGNSLVVDKALTTKLGRFPYSDPTVKSLTYQSGTGVSHLYQLMKDHMNKRRKLTPRPVEQSVLEERDEETEE